MYLFQLLVPRQSYLPLVTDKVQRHFLKYVDPESHGEMWLEYNGQPLKWYVTLLTHIRPKEKKHDKVKPQKSSRKRIVNSGQQASRVFLIGSLNVQV